MADYTALRRIEGTLSGTRALRDEVVAELRAARAAISLGHQAIEIVHATAGRAREHTADMGAAARLGGEKSRELAHLSRAVDPAEAVRTADIQIDERWRRATKSGVAHPVRTVPPQPELAKWCEAADRHVRKGVHAQIAASEERFPERWAEIAAQDIAEELEAMSAKWPEAKPTPDRERERRPPTRRRRAARET